MENIIPTVRFERGAVEIIDQRLLPSEYKIERLERLEDLCAAIRSLAVRGAPALGVVGAFGMLLALEERFSKGPGHLFDMEGSGLEGLDPGMSADEIVSVLDDAARCIASTRPTAVNLFGAIDRVRRAANKSCATPREILSRVYDEAMAVYREDLDMCKALGRNGSTLLEDGDTVLTHCNTGGLATSGFGTALGVVFTAIEEGKRIEVLAGETRPLLQGARLTAWECLARKIPVKVVTDGMAGYLISRGMVSCVLVGADRIAANGDTANKIGTLSLAVIASHYSLPFYVAAPSSSVDLSLPDGSGIPIEQRPEEEVRSFAGVEVAPAEVGVLNPAFDVTPAGLISAIVTELDVFRPPFDGLPRAVERSRSASEGRR